MLTPYQAALMSIFGHGRTVKKLLGLPTGRSDELPGNDDVRRLLHSTAAPAFSGSRTDFSAHVDWSGTVAHGYGN